MAKKKLNRKKLNPNIPVFTGTKYTEKVSIQLFKYNSKTFVENKNLSGDIFKGFVNDENQYWLNTHGIHDVELITKISEKSNLHSLTIQDILDINQRPKFQDFEHYWFFSLKSILPLLNNQIESEQLSFVLGENFLMSFQEKERDYFNHVRKRIRENIGIVRSRGVDYLLYLLLESILDNYFKTIGSIETSLDRMGLLDMETDPSPLLLKTVEQFQQQIHQVRKTINPIKEFVVKIEREELGLVKEMHMKYFYELKDLCLTLIDECDQIDLRLSGNINLFFSLQGHRMNQVMKTLTIVATIFIPLTFIAGIYGMNFSNMPELNWKWGYLGVWLIIFLVFIIMINYFRRKKWF